MSDEDKLASPRIKTRKQFWTYGHMNRQTNGQSNLFLSRSLTNDSLPVHFLHEFLICWSTLHMKEYASDHSRILVAALS